MALTLADQIRRFRVLAKDAIEPYRAKTVDVVDSLNDAQVQGCIRGRLLVADGDPALCEIAMVGGQQVYPLHPALYELIHLRITSAGDKPRTVVLKSREWLDRERPGWRDCDVPAEIAIQDDTSLRMVGAVKNGETLRIEAYRLPLAPMELDTDEPEIHGAHHEHLIQWALHKAFSIPDSQLFDPERAALSERAFTRYFGPLPDSDLRRITREDVVHHNEAVLP